MGKKEDGQKSSQKPQKRKLSLPKGSSHSAQERKKKRQEAHQRRVEKKEKKLRKRISELGKLLKRGEDIEPRPGQTLGTFHKRLRRTAKKKGLL